MHLFNLLIIILPSFDKIQNLCMSTNFNGINLLLLLILCLIIVLVVVVIQFIRLKRNLRRFTREVEKLKDVDYNQPVKVTCFDRDIVALATKINEHVDLQHSLSTEYKREKKKLNNIISGISHDFRTPLTASLGYLQMIAKSDTLSEKNKEYLSVAIEKNKYLNLLSDEFFELSKLENQTGELISERINLSNLLTDSLMEQYPWIEKRKITPHFDIEDGIMITSNVHYVTRIIQNLFSNSEKYAFHTFGVRLSRKEENIELAVYNDTTKDCEINMNKVFEPFYKENARSEKGSGLGLYVVKCLSEKLGFEVTASLVLHHTFMVTIIFAA